MQVTLFCKQTLLSVYRIVLWLSHSVPSVTVWCFIVCNTDFDDILATVSFLMEKNPLAKFWTTYQERRYLICILKVEYNTLALAQKGLGFSKGFLCLRYFLRSMGLLTDNFFLGGGGGWVLLKFCVTLAIINTVTIYILFCFH